MKILTTLILTSLTLFSLNATTFAGKIHTLDDIREAEREAKKTAALERRLIQTDPSLLRKFKREQAKQEELEKFPGHGHRLGGDKYVNRLLGIDHKEGKRLAKLAKKSGKKLVPSPLLHAKESSDEVVLKTTRLTVTSQGTHS